VLPIGPSGETVAASSGQGKIPRAQPLATSRQSRIQPNPCVQPRMSWAFSLIPPTQTTISDISTHISAAE
jgi:hypothetical protein